MSFVPVVETKFYGKRTNDCQRRPVDMLYHNCAAHNEPVHTTIKTFAPKAHRLQDDLSIPHGGRGRPNNPNLLPHNPLTDAPMIHYQKAAQQEYLPWRRSQTSMDYIPTDRRRDDDAKWFADQRGNASILKLTAVDNTVVKPMRLPPIPPPENEVPGFRGMGNPILIVPNERPNQAAAVRTSSVPLKQLPFLGERKNCF